MLNADSSSPLGSSFSRSLNVVCTWVPIVEIVDVTVVSALARPSPFLASLIALSILSTPSWMSLDSVSIESFAWSPELRSGLPTLLRSSFSWAVES